MPTVDIDKIVVGSYYRNNVVTKIDEEVKDLKNGKVKIRKFFTLDDGMIVIEDTLYDFEEIVGEYKELQYNNIAFPDMSPGKKKKTKKIPKDRNSSPTSPCPSSPPRDDGEDYEEEKRREIENARRQAEELALIEAHERVRRQEEDRARLEGLALREAEERLRYEAEKRARLEEEEKKIREAEAERRRIVAQEEARIQQIRQNWQPKKIRAFTSHNEDKGESIRATWNLSLDSEKEHKTKNWPVKEIILYPPTQSLPDTGTPHGYWCYSSQDLQPNERDIEWIPQEIEDGEAPFWVFLPDEGHPPDDDVLFGEWCMASPNVWPPPLHHTHYCVHPPKTKPPVSLTSDKGVGIWWVGSNFPPIDADAWNVSEVRVYEDGQRPGTRYSRQPQGTWGIAAGAQPQKDGTYEPSDTWFILPGEELPDDSEWTCRGSWVLETKDNDRWPPYQEPPLLTTVYHEDNVEDTDGRSNQNRAIWVQNADIKASDWLPQKVLAYKMGHEPGIRDSSKPHGLWGRDPDSRPDADGNYFPMDVWFVFPGEDAPTDDEWVCEGTWIVDSHEDWMPYQESPSEPERFIVCHPSQLNGHPINSSNAIWRIGEGFPDIDDNSWELAPVLAYKFGNEPENLNEKPNGLWGRAIDAKPDENGQYDPRDTWIVFPGDTPPEHDEWNCCGVWILDDTGKKCPEWPPHKKIRPSPIKGPILATIYPEKKAYKENAEIGKTKGMWKYTAGKKVMDAGKQPKDVYLHSDGQGIDCEAAKNGGAWGYAPQAKPDSNGNFAPCDVWCFAPGERPPPEDDWQHQGYWMPIDPPQGAKNKAGKLEIPSTHSSTDSQSSVRGATSALEEKKIRTRRFAHSAWVFPSNEHLPPGHKNNLQGVWSTPPGDQPGGKQGIKYKDGEPMEVIVHQRGKEPCESDLKKIAHGKWGYRKDAQPNSRGIMDPKNIIFFPPGVECDADVNEEGIWTCPGAVIREITRWRFDDDNNIIHIKSTEIHFMNTVTTFTTEYVKKQ
jgi:hypothetical protein